MGFAPEHFSTSTYIFSYDFPSIWGSIQQLLTVHYPKLLYTNPRPTPHRDGCRQKKLE